MQVLLSTGCHHLCCSHTPKPEGQGLPRTAAAPPQPTSQCYGMQERDKPNARRAARGQAGCSTRWLLAAALSCHHPEVMVARPKFTDKLQPRRTRWWNSHCR